MNGNNSLTILVTNTGGSTRMSTILLLKDFYRVVLTDINLYLEGVAVSHRYYIISSAGEGENFIKDLEEIVERKKVI